MFNNPSRDLSKLIREEAHPLTGQPGEFSPLLDIIGDARFALLGEATHGTHEFYAARAEISRQLILQRGFTAVAVEADWPDAYRVNLYVRGVAADRSAEESLRGFERFPTWMWRNRDVVEFVEWLREYNRQLPPGAPRVGFYGLDLYSLHRSQQAVVQYLEKVDPEGARRARYRYACFDHYGEDPQSYGYAASFGLGQPCEDQVLEQLLDLQRHAAEYANRDGHVAEDEFFFAEQNARLVRNAEQYYRTMFSGRVSSWNLRDQHMTETLRELTDHLSRTQGSAKVAVWEHNSHLGDARATQMGEDGEWNVGQLVRERYGKTARLIGFTTHTGTVTAADNWDEPGITKRVRPSLSGSYEDLFHQVGMPAFLLPLHTDERLTAELRQPRLERAIGVVYRPQSERVSHYFRARLSDQFDAVLHYDESRAVEPLEQYVPPDHDEVPETFPSGV